MTRRVLTTFGLAWVLLVTMAGVALGAWSASGAGGVAARAGTLAAPSVTASAPTCVLPAQRSTFSWPAVTGASSYQVDQSTSGTFPGTVTTTTATSVTITAKALAPRTVYSVRVRAVAGGWTGPWSTTATASLGPCLA